MYCSVFHSPHHSLLSLLLYLYCIFIHCLFAAFLASVGIWVEVSDLPEPKSTIWVYHPVILEPTNYLSCTQELIISFFLCKLEQESLAWLIPSKILVWCSYSSPSLCPVSACSILVSFFFVPDWRSLRPAVVVDVQGVQEVQPDEYRVGAPRPDPDLGCLGPCSHHWGWETQWERRALWRWDREFPYLGGFSTGGNELTSQESLEAHGGLCHNLRVLDQYPGVAESPGPESSS